MDRLKRFRNFNENKSSNISTEDVQDVHHLFSDVIDSSENINVSVKQKFGFIQINIKPNYTQIDITPIISKENIDDIESSILRAIDVYDLSLNNLRLIYKNNSTGPGIMDRTLSWYRKRNFENEMEHMINFIREKKDFIREIIITFEKR